MSTQPSTQPMLRIPRSAHPTPTEPRLRSRRLPAWAYALVILVVSGGLLIAAGATPWYATTGRDAQVAKAGSASVPAANAAGTGADAAKNPAAGTDAANNPAAGKGTGTDSANKVAPTSGDVADIKGWMTLQQVLDGYPVSKDALYQAFSIPADTPASTTLQKLAESTGADVPAIRTWVADNQK
ncbi:MAG: hypothetical protein WCP28_02635 [Actinomycetes bacterium]